MDITTDGFGFMLVFGDLSWVPFMYSLQARYLVAHSPVLSPAAAAGIFALHALGMYIFRSANSQKDTFRSNPNDPSVKGGCAKAVHTEHKHSRMDTHTLTVPGPWCKNVHSAVRLLCVVLARGCRALFCCPGLSFIKTETGSRLLTAGW